MAPVVDADRAADLRDWPAPPDIQASGIPASVLGSGWGPPEQDCARTSARRSELVLPPVTRATPMVLELDVAPWIAPPLVRAQILRISINGVRLGSARLTARTVLRWRIAADMLGPGAPVAVLFEMPCFARADLLGTSHDPTPRGMAVFSARLLPEPVSGANAPEPWPPEVTRSDAAPLDIRFATTGEAVAGSREGWHIADDGGVWTGGLASHVHLAAQQVDGPFQIRISLAPLIIRPILPSQRLTVIVNGCVIAQFRLASDTCLAVAVPAEVMRRDEESPVLEVVLVTPDAFSLAGFAPPLNDQALAFLVDRIVVEPSDLSDGLIAALRDDEYNAVTPLAVSNVPVEAGDAAAGAALGDALRRFESVGDNCSFGIVQRKAGVEVLGLLRFGTIPLPSLLRGLEDEFQALSDPTEISVEYGPGRPREFLIAARRYGIRWHTYVSEAVSTAETVLRDNITKLGYLRRKFYEGLRAERKIYVISRAASDPIALLIPMPKRQYVWYKQSEPLRLAEILPVLQQLRKHGRNRLLVIVPSKAGRSSGTVELLAPGLMRGYVASMTISDQLDVADHTEWLRVVANASLIDSRPVSSPD
jgi:hypothetical protein